MKKYSSVIAIILSLSMMLAGCGKSASEDPKANKAPSESFASATMGEIGAPKEGVEYQETITTSHSSDNENPDPYASTSSGNRIATNMYFDDLVHIDPVTNKMVGELAKSWKDVKGDGRIWEFSLEKNVKFHNGDPFTAADVKFTFERATPGTGKTIETISVMKSVENIEIIDDYTVRFNLKEPILDFYAWCTYPIASKKAFETMDAKEAGVIGTGPYILKLENWKLGVQYTLVRNDNYWKGTKDYATKKIVVKCIQDENTRTAAFQSGELDFAYNMSASFAKQVSGQNYKYYKREGAYNYLFGFNLTQERFKNKELRKAIAMAVNRKDFVEVAFEKGLGASEAYNLIAKDSLGYAEINQIKYDPKGAIEILKKLGYTKEKPLDLKICYFANMNKMAEVLQASLSQLEGLVNPQLEQKDSSNWVAFLRTKQGFDIYLSYFQPVGALTYAIDSMFSKGAPWNYATYESPEFEAMLKKVNSAPSEEAMIKEFANLQQFVADEAVNIPVVYKTLLAAGKPGLEGFVQAATLNDLDFATVRIPKKSGK